MKLCLMTILQPLLFALLAPLLMGVVKRIKCRLQNRRGPSIYQPYRNLIKLFRKENLVSSNASPIFRFTPYIVFSSTLLASAAVPLFVLNTSGSIVTDGIVLVGLFALGRFFLALAGMDIGTAFGGMGSSREMLIAASAEPALLLTFFTLAMIAGSTNLNVIVAHFAGSLVSLQPSLIFAAIGFVLVAIAETGRIPVDNPATHLELTMVHEAMILEYTGSHLALLEWAAQIKFMIYSVLLVNLFFPWGIANTLTFSALGWSFFTLALKVLVFMLCLAIAELNLAKLRLFRVPYLLNLAFLLCLLGLLSHIILEVG